ncbi:MAG: cytidylyltransferase domain-containing protein [Nitrospirota bacterium]
MRILALIAARGGSKRVPGKNLRRLGGKPLIVWSIDVAKGVPEICDILVSTDAPNIAEVARHGGALVPWLRPESLATDDALSVDVCLHAMNWYEAEKGAVDGVLLLQPTSPFRSRRTLMRGIELFRATAYRPVLGVSPAQSHPWWCFRIEGGTLRPFVDGDGLHRRSQDLPPAYVINGAFYLVTPEHLRQHRSFYSDDMLPLVMDHPAESLDIDTEWDWKAAQEVLAARGADSR